jgi:heat shock protein HtpX
MQMMKVFALMTGLTVLLVVAGDYLGGPSMALGMLILAVIMNVGAYWFSDRAVLKMYDAKVIGSDDAPELYTMVDRLRLEAGLPMPTIAIAPSEQPNAFATGRNQNHAVVCVTSGILQLVSTRELEGVIAHELAHIKNRNMLFGTVAATVAGAIAMLASIAKWGLFLGGRGRRSDGGGNLLVMIAAMIIAPMAAAIIQMMISRSNEFQADATAARITSDPAGLASALQKIESYAQKIPMQVNPAAAQLAIINPLAGSARDTMSRLFSTHPPTEKRVAKLRGMRI